MLANGRAALPAALILTLLLTGSLSTSANQTTGTSGSIRIKLRQQEPVVQDGKLAECVGAQNEQPGTWLQYLYRLGAADLGWLPTRGGQERQKFCYAALRSAAFMPFTGYVQIGDPPQLFEALFDTGSDVLWVPHSHCQLNNLDWESGLHAKFASDKSRTYKRLGRERLSLKYGNNMEFKGWWVRDQIELPDARQISRSLVVHDQDLGLICYVNVPGEHYEPEFDAMVGLSFPSELSAGKVTLLERLRRDHLLEKQVFSFHVNRRAGKTAAQQQTGELIFGHIDASLYTGDITWAPVARGPHWEIRVHTIRLMVDGEPRAGDQTPKAVACEHGCYASLDTGTSMITGPQLEVERLNQQLGFRQNPKMPELYMAPGSCDSYRQLGLSLVVSVGDAHLELKPENFLMDVDASPGVQICLSALRSLASTPNSWILGAPFISSFYTIFDYGHKRVGFARPIQLEP